MNEPKKHVKIAVLGAGNVGATIAYTLTTQGMASEIVMVDLNADKAKGEALDIFHGTSMTYPVNIYSGDYPEIADSDIVVFSVGKARSPGMTRTDLTRVNVDITRQVMTEAVKYAPDAIYVIVSNPVDILTYVISTEFGLDSNKVIGSGTVLDSARLHSILSRELGVDARDIDAMVLAEHGETSFVPWSTATIGGSLISEYKAAGGPDVTLDYDAVEVEMRKGGATVIPLKGATFYAIALSVNKICDAILRNSHSVMPVSTRLEGQYGVEDVCLSIPCVIGSSGIQRKLAPALTQEEVGKMKHSADALKVIMKDIDL